MKSLMNIKTTVMSGIIVIIQGNIGGCSGYLLCKIPDAKKIPVVFHNGSNYDYHFIIKELAEVFEGQFECLVCNILCINEKRK